MKNTHTIAAFIVLILVIAGGWYYLGAKDTTSTQQAVETAAEEMDTMDMSESELTTATQTEQEAEVPPSDSKVFTVSGTNFAFDLSEIRVKQGDVVTIDFESSDGFHDWVLDEFDAATAQVRPGTPTSITFVADKVGTYEYYCSVGSHRANGMVGTFIVE